MFASIFNARSHWQIRFWVTLLVLLRQIFASNEQQYVNKELIVWIDTVCHGSVSITIKASGILYHIHYYNINLGTTYTPLPSVQIIKLPIYVIGIYNVNIPCRWLNGLLLTNLLNKWRKCRQPGVTKAVLVIYSNTDDIVSASGMSY